MNKATTFTAQNGIPLSYLIVLNEDSNGGPPGGDDAMAYAQEVGAPPGQLVSADPNGQLYSMTPWMGSPRPGKCALAPDMTIISCWTGADDTAGHAAIVTHAQGN